VEASQLRAAGLNEIGRVPGAQDPRGLWLHRSTDGGASVGDAPRAARRIEEHANVCLIGPPGTGKPTSPAADRRRGRLPATGTPSSEPAVRAGVPPL